jgi:heme exporter protein A
LFSCSWFLVLENMPHIELHLDNITIDYGSRRVVAGVSLTLRAGETLVVAGANGSGKSSLLRVLCGLQRPSCGTAYYLLDGNALRPDHARDLVGWLSPDLQLYRELTALENLRFFAQVRGLALSDAELTQRLDSVGLKGRGADLLAAYSSGMAQRLRYAYALLHAPPVLLLDEPTATFDEQGTALFERVVEEHQARHGLLVIATNDPRELRFGDYVLRLGAGG